MTTKKTAAKAPKKSGKLSAKPSLTSSNVNQLIRPLLGQKGPAGRAAKLGKDWRAFIASELSLSKAQTDNLQNIPAEEVEKVQRALREAIKHGGEFSLSLGSESARKGAAGELTIKGAAAAGKTARSFTIPLVKCTFDANCRNWKCKFGLDPR
jgi:hypothetical protein